jgi:hypothetical protein
LSGGGANGAFTVGVLNGWSSTGARPQFDVVTGVSTGALISTFAFLGPAYDQQLCEFYTNTCSSDIYRKKPKLAVLWSDSLASSEPLKKQIDARIDCNVLQAVAAAHAQGRRLFVGTTNLDTRRLIVWDMGAIASSGRPDSLELYRSVILASASVPGFFPPVPIDVQINGQRYTELHVDGATTSEVFIRGSMFNVDHDAVKAGKQPLAGSSIYIILAGKAYVDPDCVKPTIPSIGGSAVSALTAAQARGDLIRIWTMCLVTGMNFRVAAIPQEYPAPKDSLEFDPTEMRKMFAEGYRLAASGQVWRDKPPGYQTQEQVVPRAGTEFLTPYVIESPARPIAVAPP